MSFGLHLVLERPYYIAAYEIVVGLGPQRTHSFAVFHALAGCDAVSSFDGHGQKTEWVLENVLPELTKALVTLASPDDIPQEVMATIERFTILIYNHVQR